MSTDLFLNYITQVRSKYKVRARPLFLNGIIEDNAREENSIVIFQLLPDVIGEKAVKALSINSLNPAVSKIYAITNETDVYENGKIFYIKKNKFFGLQFGDIFPYFHTYAVNVLLFDSVVIDFNATRYLKNLSNKQVGLLSSKLFYRIPDDIEKYNTFSEINEKKTFEFNGIAFTEVPDVGTDLYVNMFGSINILLSLLALKSSIVNLSDIVISYLFETHPFSQDNYVTNNFPVVCSFPQVYFGESSVVSIPEIDELESFICQTPECLSYSPPQLRPEDEYEINTVKNKMLQQAYYQYKLDYDSKTKLIDDSLVQYKAEQLVRIQTTLKNTETDGLSEIERTINALKVSKIKELEAYDASEKFRIGEMTASKIAEADEELAEYKKKKTASIEKKCQEQLDIELAETKRIIYITQQDELAVLQLHIDKRTSELYAEVNEAIDEYRAIEQKKIDDDMAIKKNQLLVEADIENNENKIRLETLLVEYEKCKKNEIIVHYQTHYLKAYNEMIAGLNERSKGMESRKLEEVFRTVELYRLTKTEEINRIHSQEKAQLKEKLASYEIQQKIKIDEHFAEYKRLATLDGQIEINKELHEYQEKRRQEIDDACAEYDRLQREKAEFITQTYTDSLKSEADVKNSQYKKEQLEKINTILDEEYAKLKSEKLAQHTELLKIAFRQIELDKLNNIDSKYQIKLQHLATEYSNQKSKCDAELQDYKDVLIADAHAAVQKIKDAELPKIEAYQKYRLEEINFENDMLIETLEKNRKVMHQQNIENLSIELEKEKQIINDGLVKEYKVKLLEQNAILEESVRREHKNKFSEIKLAHDTAIDELNIKFQELTTVFQNRQTVERAKMVSRIESDQLALEKEVIRNHNENLARLEKEYDQMKRVHTDLIKKTVSAERVEMIEQEKQAIRQTLAEYKTQLIEKDMAKAKEEVMARISEVKRVQTEEAMQEIAEIKAQKLREIDTELKEYKARNEEQLQKQFSNFLSVLKDM